MYFKSKILARVLFWFAYVSCAKKFAEKSFYFYRCCFKIYILPCLQWIVFFENKHNFQLRTQFTLHRCTFEYPSWVNLCGPTLDCTANIQILKQQRSVNSHVWCKPISGYRCFVLNSKNCVILSIGQQYL